MSSSQFAGFTQTLGCVALSALIVVIISALKVPKEAPRWETGARKEGEGREGGGGQKELGGGEDSEGRGQRKLSTCVVLGMIQR